MKTLRVPGLTAYAAIVLWLLLAVINAASAREKSVVAADISRDIAAALLEKGAPEEANIVFANPAQPVPVAEGGAPQIDSVSYNRQSGRFLARLSGFGAHGVVLSGTALAPIETPVLVAPIARGEIIAEDDIEFVMLARAMPTDAILEVEDLIGAQARHALKAGAPLRKSDLARPELVKKGALVTVTYEAPGLRIAQSGVAQTSGGAGDVIDVETMTGARAVRAVVTGRNAALVRHPRLAQLQSEGLRARD